MDGGIASLALEEDAHQVDTWVFVLGCVLGLIGLVPSFLFLIFNLKYKTVRYGRFISLRM